jgi:hypothetical protein
MLSDDGHFFIPVSRKVRKEEKEIAVGRTAKRTEFLLLTQSLRPALVTISVLLVGAAVLLNF